MSAWSQMGVVIRPDIHERFRRIVARADAALPALAPEAPVRRRRGRARLAPSSVETIRSERAAGTTLETLARRFHVATSTVHRAAAGVTWVTP